jgi:pseudaminic acid synthase
MKIDRFNIGVLCKPFIIAEMSGNHNQSLKRALAIVEAAAKSGAHALKLQTYTADTMTLDINEREFVINDVNSLWHGNSLYKLYKLATTPWEWHQPIMDRAEQLGLVCFSTPFDAGAVDFLESLNVPCYKIASFENTDIALIERVAMTGKPIMISTGMASIAELHESVCAARKAGCKDLVLLKCTSEYPASAENSNLRTIPHMRDLFDCEVGLSDHTVGLGTALASVALGATIIEKHLTLNRTDGGVDSAFSLEPNELASLVTESERAWLSLGQVKYGTSSGEESSLMFRRSLYIVADMRAGDMLTDDNVKSIRPGYGLQPKYITLLLGKRVNRDVRKGTPVNWDMFA